MNSTRIQSRVSAAVFLSLLVLLFFQARRAMAGDYDVYDRSSRSRFGFELERFKGGSTDSGTQGGLLGLRSSIYPFHGHFNVGGQIYFGTPHGGSLSNDNLLYGGVSLGFDGSFANIFAYDFSLLIGYGYGTSSTVSGQSLAIQPTVGLGFVVIKGWRATFNPGYLYMPGANGFSGITFGIRLERKTDSNPGIGVDN